MSSTTERATTSDEAPSRDLCGRVGEILSRGGLVALPTETVYGIAARVDEPAGYEALLSVKGRPGDMPSTWHVGSTAALERFPRPSPMARRLAQRYWPGPLTLVLPGVPPGLERAARGGWTGIRRPAHRATAGILESLDFPVVLSSANRHGERPLGTADDVERELGQHLDLIVDAGPSRLGEASCVLRVGPGHFDLVRAGLFTLEQLRAVAGLRIGFVCTGNTCRSPMAEAIARAALAQRLGVAPGRLGDFGFALASMGLQAAIGAPASETAVEVLRERGLDLAGHSSRPAVIEEIGRLDRAYALTRAHAEALILMLPPGRVRNVDLLDPAGRDVPDPIGGTREDYVRAADRISEAVAARLDEWA